MSLAEGIDEMRGGLSLLSSCHFVPLTIRGIRGMGAGSDEPRERSFGVCLIAF
jgi:hypothetical protein